MLHLINDFHPSLLLATAVHVVEIVSSVVVNAFTARELVPLPPVPGSVQVIVPVAPVEYVLATEFIQISVVVVAPVDDIIAPEAV